MKFPLNYMKIRNVFGHSQSRKKLKIFVEEKRKLKSIVFYFFLISEKRKMIVSKKEKIVVF